MPDKSNTQTEINLLTALESGEVTTQMRLAQRVAVSVGLVNALLKRAVIKGYVKVRTAPAKRYAYYLTPKGFTEKSRLVANYLETSLDFFRLARSEYGEIFQRLNQHDERRIILAGRGELTEIALLAAREYGIEPTAVLDLKTNTDTFHGIKIIRHLDELQNNDTIIITESRYPQNMIDELRYHQRSEHLLFPPILQVRVPMISKDSLMDIEDPIASKSAQKNGV